MNNRPLIIAHRGASGLAPENTLAAFAKAIELGVDRIEMDLRQTIDGEVVVLHDKTINRTSNGWGSVRKLSLKKCKSYSAGSWFHHDFSAERIPTFREVLELVNGRATLLLEIKNGSPYHHGIEKNIIDLVNEFDAHEWCIVQSFNDRILKNFRELPDLHSNIQKLFAAFIPVAPFYGGSRFSYKRVRRYDFADEININYKYVNPRVVRKMHQMGKKVNVWTVNQPENLKKYMEIGVDGIITDYPDRLIKLL
ncbi:MAG: glycerophosphodiester phosphodiesterase family protein [Vicingaceae bacterium]